MLLLPVHIVIALSSVLYTTYLFVSPTKAKFYVSYGLIGLTLTTGTILVISTHSPLLSSCETGLVYLGVVLSGVIAASRRFAHSEVSVRSKQDDR